MPLTRFLSYIVVLGLGLGAGWYWSAHDHHKSAYEREDYHDHHDSNDHKSDNHKNDRDGAGHHQDKDDADRYKTARYEHGHTYEHAHTMAKGHKDGRHDEVNMPGLHGTDTTDDEVNDLKALFINHRLLERRVEPLPNGIRTITETDDARLRAALVNHVSMMLTRIEDGRNPHVMIQSPTLDRLFAVNDKISTEIEMTDRGIAVVQTSNDKAVVTALQTHAGEVSDMAARGMDAVHDRMRQSGGHEHKQGHKRGHKQAPGHSMHPPAY
jgi:hypothetical protein